MAANDCMTSHWGGADAGPRQRLAYAFAGAATMVLISLAPGVAKAQAGVGPAPMPGAAAQPFALGGLPLTFGVQERTTYDTNVAGGNEVAAAIRNLDTRSEERRVGKEC